jgi:tocopherol cyclase
VMGIDDGYICHHSTDTSSFWADRNDLSLGAGIRAGLGPRYPPRARITPSGGIRPGHMLPSDTFFEVVDKGFQASYVKQTGSIISNEAGTSGAPLSTVSSCSWDLEIRPMTGWGGENGGPQKATAGWLSVLSVFEPHWQVLMSHGLASGWFEWDGQRYEFTDAPTYAEKNWGGAFPSKWHWVQCNSFEGHRGLSLTAVGARRGLAPTVPVVGSLLGEEDVGMIGIHIPMELSRSGKVMFLEMVPWEGEVEWTVEPWGKWWIRAKCNGYEALVEASCASEAGAVLRAPTASQGLAPFCKDTFFGQCRLRVWSSLDGQRELILDASSTTAALEVGGGAWWGAWTAKAEMKEPFKTLVRAPLDLGTIGQLAPGIVKPPGL